MRLPELPCQLPQNSAELLELRGINFSDCFRDGDLAWCENLSFSRWPYLAARRARSVFPGYAGATALTAWGKLVAVKGTQLLYDGQAVGTVTAGEKQFAVVNTRLVIWPDKVFLDLDSRTVKPLGASASGAGASFTTDAMTVSGWPDLTALFRAGDCVTLSGCSTAANNKDVVIKSVTAGTITVQANGFTAGADGGTITVERRVPDLDFICESANRLWGCSNSTRTIYASALGDPTNFFVYQGLATDSYAVAVGSEGDFTGCCKLSTAVLFWKETCLHKLLGAYPAEYALYTYEIEGLKAGCHKSLDVINEVLFYQGARGIYAYSGGVPTLVSGCFGEKEFSGGVAGDDGERYYLSTRDREGNHHLLVYEASLGLWLREDDTRCVDFARIGRDLYFLNGKGEVWKADAGVSNPDLEWSAQFTPFYESVGSRRRRAMEGRKRYGKLTLRLELPRGAWVQAEVRFDGGLWQSCGKVVGAEADSVPLCVRIARCDKFELRLRGKGPCTVKSVARSFMIGSDRS